MKYMMLLYITPDEARESDVQGWLEFETAASTARVLVAKEALYPPAHAVTVRVLENNIVTRDGSEIETNQQLGGYYVLECKDLNDAINWAAKMPIARYGMIEIRPVMEFQ